MSELKKITPYLNELLEFNFVLIRNLIKLHCDIVEDDQEEISKEEVADLIDFLILNIAYGVNLIDEYTSNHEKYSKNAKEIRSLMKEREVQANKDKK